VQPMGERHNTSRHSVSADRQILLSLRSAHDRRHIFNVLQCVPIAPLRLARACACCITAVDVARRYELHALAARQRRQLTPRLLVTGWTAVIGTTGYALTQPACMVALAAADTTAAAAAAAATTAAAVHPGVVNLQTFTSYGLAIVVPVPLRVESGANREEKTYIEGVHYVPSFLRIRHHRRPRRRCRRRRPHHLRHPCHCISLGSPPLELSALSPPSLAATHRPP
jgi:hypothetical protein